MTNNVYADEADRLERSRPARLDGCDLCSGAHTNEEHLAADRQRLLDLVAGMKLDAFAAWLEARALATKSPFKRKFLAGDECECPLAQWLHDVAGQTLYVGDDAVTDADLCVLGDMPAWAYRFVREFDEAFGAPAFGGDIEDLRVDAVTVGRWFQQLKPTLEALDNGNG